MPAFLLTPLIQFRGDHFPVGKIGCGDMIRAERQVFCTAEKRIAALRTECQTDPAKRIFPAVTFSFCRTPQCSVCRQKIQFAHHPPVLCVRFLRRMDECRFVRFVFEIHRISPFLEIEKADRFQTIGFYVSKCCLCFVTALFFPFCLIVLCPSPRFRFPRRT